MFSSFVGINLTEYILANTIMGVEIKADLRIIILENLMKSYPPFRTGLL